MNDLRKLLNELSDEPWGMDHEPSAIKLARQLLAQLAEYGQKGLPDVYEDAEEYMFDMYADLPWDFEGQSMALQWMLEQPELQQINQDWIKNIGFNIQAELQGAYEETVDELRSNRP